MTIVATAAAAITAVTAVAATTTQSQVAAADAINPPISAPSIKYAHKYLKYKEEEPYTKDSSPFFIKKFYFYLA